MKQMDDYVIPFKGLAEEIHQFHYEIDGSFFEELAFTELHHGFVIVDLVLNKQERMMTLHFSIKGDVEVSCDRCLESFRMPLEGERELYLKFGDEYKEEDEDVIVLPLDAYQIDIRPFLYEYIMLMLPIKRVHPEEEDDTSGCNPEMLQLLNQHQAVGYTDARWDALKEIKEKLGN